MLRLQSPATFAACRSVKPPLVRNQLTNPHATCCGCDESNLLHNGHFFGSRWETLTTPLPPHVLLTGDRRTSSNLQDILRLLTLWFTWGHTSPEVEAALQEGFGLVCIDTWLVVIPQIIARIHTQVEPVKRLIRMLLVRIGRHHPQALMYPLLVACKSQSPSRRAAAEVVMDEVRQQNATLVEQATLVSNELIRIAILWHELWHEALEEASRLYFGESNVEGMLSTLLPLHEMMDSKGACTLKEIAFEQAYGRELKEAYDWCLKYKVSRREAELHQAWDLYYHVFKRINKQLPTLTVLDLQYVSPALVKACVRGGCCWHV